ncbi:P-loop containing nucleoside triphosphate hydrolase protein [Amylocystis lapponica]|nr:P-loop containing nucleoside triphosphate hydrolase protein [Amylocystis lapponica]
MPASKWSIKKIRDLVKSKFKKQPCLFQVKVAQALRERQNDVVAIAATGSGKTLSFWIPLLMALEDKEDKLIIVVTPLNILGKQSVDILQEAGLSGVAVDAKTARKETFQEIEAGKHQVVVMNPEIIMQAGGYCEQLWRKPAFTSKLLYVVFDEGHCISEWILIPDTIPFYVASATLPAPVLLDVADTLHLRKGHTEHIFRSNDRPDIGLAVRKMQYAAASYHDLDFLIPDGFQEGDIPPPKFLIFFDNTKEAEAAVRHLRSRLPDHLRHKTKHLHSIMTPDYRTDEYEALRNGDTYGLCVTDSFGMGLDLPNIQLIIQWKAPSNMNTLWQRFGCAARADGVHGVAILIVEKTYFDNKKEKKDKKPKRQNKKRKSMTMQDTPNKRPTLSEQRTSEDDEECRRIYNERAGSTTIGSKLHGKEARTLQPAMLDLINAGSRGFQCRRKPIMLVYSNDKRREWHSLV